MSKPIPKTDYAYAVGVVRALEKLLLNENEVERMVLSEDASDAFRILNETDYADNKAGITDPAEFPKVLGEGMIDIKKKLQQATPNSEILNILWYQYDFHNIKTLIKAKMVGKTYEDVEHLMSFLGAMPIEALRKFIFDEELVSFDMEDDENEKYLKIKIKKVQEVFEKVKNPQVIDLYMDQKMIKIMHRIARNSGDDFVHNYIRKYIDCMNIKQFFRMKSQDKDVSLYEMAVLWKGLIPHQRFIDAYKHSLSDFPEIMKATAYNQIISEGHKDYEEKGSFAELEKQIENHLIEYIKKAKLTPFGPGPLLAYFLAKQNNAYIIRMIMVNKLNYVNPEEIKSRLRNLYL